MHKASSNPMPSANEHFVQLYHSDSELTDSVGAYAQDVLNYDRQGMLFFATRRHCEAFRRALVLRGMDVGGAMARHQVRFVHVEDVLPKIVQAGAVDPDQFHQLVTAEFARMRREGGIRHIHVYGEIVDVLWRRGDTDATVRLEQLWNGLRSKEAFTLYCAYFINQKPLEALQGPLQAALCTHTSLMQEVPVDGVHPRRVFSDIVAMAHAKVPLPAVSVGRAGGASA